MEDVSHLCLYERRIAPGAEWSAAGAGWTVVLAVRGFFYWIAPGAARELNAGDVLVIGPGASGVLRASVIGEPMLQYFSFRPEHLGGLMSLTERVSLQSFAEAAYTRFLPASNPIALEFNDLVTHAVKHQGFLLRCRILHLIGMIFSETTPLPSKPAMVAINTAELRFEQLIEGIPDSDLMMMSSEKLAYRCGCSARHFRRLFRKRFNTSIRSKQTELRLEKARQMLADTEEKVVAVAIESGYRHLGLFNASFKKRFGMTPTEWRRVAAANVSAEGTVMIGAASR
ncbi:MAG TPA: helix-turn-helix transcriptional regulator [Candidatus Acidoferrum sp.]|nr:helix-turn-helix transcriptional regulator [Candidatus Acidoferrum sp.]